MDELITIAAEVNPRIASAEENRWISFFDRFAAHYHRTDIVTLGLMRWARQRARRGLQPQPGHHIVDAMAGPGSNLQGLAHAGCLITLIDFSEAMCWQARRQVRQLGLEGVRVQTGDAIKHLERIPADGILATFALKTLSDAEVRRLARSIATSLRPGGRFSAVELSACSWQQKVFRGYLSCLIGLGLFREQLSRLRSLTAGADCFAHRLATHLEEQGLIVDYRRHPVLPFGFVVARKEA